MRPIAIAVSTNAARCKRFPASPNDCPKRSLNTTISWNPNRAWIPAAPCGPLPGPARFLSRATRLPPVAPSRGPPPSIRAAATAPLAALYFNGMESACAGGILKATRILPAVRMLSIGTATRRGLGALVERQQRCLRRQEAYPLKGLSSGTAHPRRHDFHGVPRGSLLRGITVDTHDARLRGGGPRTGDPARCANSPSVRAWSRSPSPASQPHPWQYRSAPELFLPGIRCCLRPPSGHRRSVFPTSPLPSRPAFSTVL